MSTRPPSPRLPDAHKAAERLRRDVERWHRDGLGPPRVSLRGQRGVGKSWALGEALTAARALSLPVVEVRPPALGLDAVAHVSLQGAGSLREASVNGVLDPAFGARWSAADKIAAVLRGIDEAGSKGLLALDLDDSWGADELLPDHASTLTIALNGIRDLESEAIAREWAVVVATSSRWGQHPVLDAMSSLEIRGKSEGRSFLEEDARWGTSTGKAAARLASELGDRAVQSTPLELRVAVGLLALPNSAMLYVRDACEAGLSRLRGMLFDELKRRRALGRVFGTLSLARFPVPEETLRAIEEELDSEEDRDVLRHALLLESPEGWLVHDSLRYSPDEGEEWRRTAHHKLIGKGGPSARIETRIDAVRWLEHFHHAAAAGAADRIPEAMDEQLPDVAVLLQLGRSLSLQRRHREASEVYERALRLSPESTYAKEYLAFNLERDGRDRTRALELFKSAVEDEPENAWWNRRLVVAWIRRGRLKEAGHAFRRALKELSESSRSGRWLADNFHEGIAQELLRRGQLPLAREVLASVHPDVLDASEVLGELYNRLLHREEVERVGVSVFPEDVPFDDRWSGPHFLCEEGRTDVSRNAKWFPARIVELDAERVELDAAQPGTDDEPATYFRTSLPMSDFLLAANLHELRGVREGQYLDLIVTDDKSEIVLHRGRSGRRPRDPWDILQGWKPDALSAAE